MRKKRAKIYLAVNDTKYVNFRFCINYGTALPPPVGGLNKNSNEKALVVIEIILWPLRRVERFIPATTTVITKFSFLALILNMF